MRQYLAWVWGRLLMPVVLIAGLAAGAVSAEPEGISLTAEPFSLEIRNADIKDVLRAVGQAGGLNIIVSDTVHGSVTMSLKNVDLWDALEAILKARGLTYVRDANMVRVLALAEAQDSDMETRVFPLGNASSGDILQIVEKVKSDKAKLSVDHRLNALVARDLSLNLDRMARLLRNLDVKIAQVQIEARIVEVSSSYSREFGVQWGGLQSNGSTVVTGGTTGVSSAGSSVAVGSTTMYPLLGDVGMSGSAYVVNLPAAVGSGSGGAVGMSFGKLGGNLSLDLQLSAMQATGNGKILSSPKVVTVNNKEAKISSGIDIPVRVTTVTTSGTVAEVKTINASLMLSTTPTIAGDNRITLAIKVEKAEPDFSRTVDGIPTITKRSANSEVVVSDGETVVLGGIVTKSQGESEAGVPFLSRIPVIGWLFKKKSRFENDAELMIFITPTIVKGL